MKLNLANCALVISLLVEYSSQYIKYSIDDDDLCSLIKKRKIRLDKSTRSGLIVKQYNLNDHSLEWKSNFRCKFQVTPSTSHEGIIAVIQYLVFRKNSTTDECIDFIQFTRKDGSSTQKFCGRFNAAVHMDHNFIGPDQSISPSNSFVDEKGDLDVFIYVAKEPLRPDEEMDLSIVFTAYKHCSQVLKRDITYRPCNLLRREFCIYSGFFNDTFVNCPLVDCEDEHGCSKPDATEGNKYGNKILIGALSTVCVIFAIFILCLWICKTYKILCWSQNFASPNSTTSQDQAIDAPRVIEMSEHEQARSSASEAHSGSANQEEDKDLPPSYDSLFPTR